MLVWTTITARAKICSLSFFFFYSLIIRADMLPFKKITKKNQLILAFSLKKELFSKFYCTVDKQFENITTLD